MSLRAPCDTHQALSNSLDQSDNLPFCKSGCRRRCFIQKGRMYSRRHKRTRVGANPYSRQNNVVRHYSNQASRALLLLHGTHLPSVRKSFETVTCGHVCETTPSYRSGDCNDKEITLFSAACSFPLFHSCRPSDACSSDSVCGASVCGASRPEHKPVDSRRTTPGMSTGYLCTPASPGVLQSLASAVVPESAGSFARGWNARFAR